MQYKESINGYGEGAENSLQNRSLYPFGKLATDLVGGFQKCPNCDEETYIGGSCSSCGIGKGEEYLRCKNQKKVEKQLKKEKKKQKKKNKPKEIKDNSLLPLEILQGYTAKYAPKKSTIGGGAASIFINLYDESGVKRERFQIQVAFSTKVERSFTGEGSNKVLDEFIIGSKMKKMKSGWKKHYFSSQEFERLRIFIRVVLSDKKYNQDLQS